MGRNLPLAARDDGRGSLADASSPEEEPTDGRPPDDGTVGQNRLRCNEMTSATGTPVQPWKREA